MADNENEQRIVEFERLNLFGKAIFIGGFLSRGAAKVIDKTLEAAADLYVETEKAFLQGKDPNIIDAHILEESEEGKQEEESQK